MWDRIVKAGGIDVRKGNLDAPHLLLTASVAMLCSSSVFQRTHSLLLRSCTEKSKVSALRMLTGPPFRVT